MNKRFALLIAEDYDDDAFLFRNAIKQTGVPLDAQFVSDGQEAIEYLEGTGRFADRNTYPIPQVILLDIKMPRLNGFEALKWDRSQPAYNSTPVIMFSSSELPADIEEAYKLGACSYLHKCGVDGNMRDRVKLLDDYWRVHNRLPPRRARFERGASADKADGEY